MKLEVTFLHSKLARRIFWLFVACALLPVGILTGISLWNVSGELKQQGLESLHQLSHDEGMTVYERLLVLESDLNAMAVSLSHPEARDVASERVTEQLEKRLKSAELVGGKAGQQIIFGKLEAEFSPNEAQKEHLASGKTVVATSNCNHGNNTCVLLARLIDPESPNKGLLVAEAVPNYLWKLEDVPEGKDICILDDRDRVLFCPKMAVANLKTETARGVSGHFEWQDFQETQEADFWKLFLKPTFGTDHWTVIASQSEREMLAPIAHFKRNFILTVLLALWIVVLLSLVQIRRSLVPLHRLSEGTRKIAKGEFSSRVKITSGDEFEALAKSFNSMAGRIDRQFRMLRNQSEIDRAILSSWDVEQMVEGLLARMMGLLHYEYASVSLMDPRAETVALTYLGSASPEGGQDVRTIELMESECKALRENPQLKVFATSDYPPSCVVPLASKGMRHFMVIPVVVRGRLASILSLGSRREEDWPEEDKLHAKQIADQLGVALSNANLLSDLRLLNQGALIALARAVDAKSHWTAGHSERVTSMAMSIGRELGLPPDEIQVLYRGGLLHDVGKIGVPNYILDKPGALTETEFQQVREHVNISGRILEPIEGFRDCMPIVMQHHEWYGGGGYPKGLKGEEIDFHARIFAVADCYDALISDRPYRSGLPLEDVVKMIEREAGKKYDPVVVKAFLKVIERMKDRGGSPKNEANPMVAV